MSSDPHDQHPSVRQGLLDSRRQQNAKCIPYSAALALDPKMLGRHDVPARRDWRSSICKREATSPSDNCPTRPATWNAICRPRASGISPTRARTARAGSRFSTDGCDVQLSQRHNQSHSVQPAEVTAHALYGCTVHRPLRNARIHRRDSDDAGTGESVAPRGSSHSGHARTVAGAARFGRFPASVHCWSSASG